MAWSSHGCARHEGSARAASARRAVSSTSVVVLVWRVALLAPRCPHHVGELAPAAIAELGVLPHPLRRAGVLEVRFRRESLRIAPGCRVALVAEQAPALVVLAVPHGSSP